MMLTELKRYLSQVKVANLAQLCRQFKTEPEFTRLLLQQWINKGKVRKAAKLPGCGSSCAKCLPEFTEVYQWLD
jgi:putative ferrous iron transport protein C